MIPSMIKMEVLYDTENGFLFINGKQIKCRNDKEATELITEHFVKKVAKKKMDKLIAKVLSMTQEGVM